MNECMYTDRKFIWLKVPYIDWTWLLMNVILANSIVFWLWYLLIFTSFGNNGVWVNSSLWILSLFLVIVIILLEIYSFYQIVRRLASIWCSLARSILMFLPTINVLLFLFLIFTDSEKHIEFEQNTVRS